MTWSFAFFTWLNAFWIMMFIAIPFSAQYIKETEKTPSPDEAYIAAPKTINWKKAFTIACVLALAVTLILALVIKSGIVPLKDSIGYLKF